MHCDHSLRESCELWCWTCSSSTAADGQPPSAASQTLDLLRWTGLAPQTKCCSTRCTQLSGRCYHCPVSSSQQPFASHNLTIGRHTASLVDLRECQHHLKLLNNSIANQGDFYDLIAREVSSSGRGFRPGRPRVSDGGEVWRAGVPLRLLWLLLGLYTRKKNRTQHHLVIFSCECMEKTTRSTKKRMQLMFNENI